MCCIAAYRALMTLLFCVCACTSSIITTLSWYTLSSPYALPLRNAMWVHLHEQPGIGRGRRTLELTANCPPPPPFEVFPVDAINNKRKIMEDNTPSAKTVQYRYLPHAGEVQAFSYLLHRLEIAPGDSAGHRTCMNVLEPCRGAIVGLLVL